MKIGNQEKALIHVAKTKLGLDEERYRDLLRSTCGVESAKDLTVSQFDALMKRFKGLGFKSTRKTGGHRQPYLTAPDCNPDALPSPAQLQKINELFEQLGWQENERRIGLNKRVIKKPWPQTRVEAAKITEALKSMIARTRKAMVQ